MAFHRVEMELGGRTLSIETGKLAKQADGSVLVQYGETIVIGTAVRAKPREGIDFFPLTVDYREKLSAAGKFPGGFRKREGAPSQKEILTMRNIDRPIRPLFPNRYFDEVQIQCWVLAFDGQNEPDVLAGIAASAALTISSIPFQGPTATVRVGRIEDQFIIMPTIAESDYSDLDMVLSGHSDGLNMIEVGAEIIPEEQVADAIEFGLGHVQAVSSLIGELAAKAGKEKVGGPMVIDADVLDAVQSKLTEPLRAAKTSDGSKHERSEAVSNAIDTFISTQFPKPDEKATYVAYMNWKEKVSQAKIAIHDLEEEVTRQIIRTGKRTDGRAIGDLRKLESEVQVLPRVHGTGLFTRGETQALVSATLGTSRDEQIIDGLGEEYAEKFYLHYNFPPFSVGEAKRITGPGRREIGHGKLAERALRPILPEIDDFPYTIRLVSDIFESNGSSSMASACGGTLALMDAGVPIKAPVGGISIGLIQADDDSQQDVYLTDIQGEEDHFGDMDFKVTGTREGITAIQLDLKIRGLNMAQIRETFVHARNARLKIIDNIEQTIAAPRETTSPHAPCMLKTTIHPDKIGKLIGPGGKTIRSLEELTGAKITIEEDGTIFLSAVGVEKAQHALEEVEKLCAEVKVGQIYSGKVISTKDFGAFIELAPGTEGLCHISELADKYVKNVSDVTKVGEQVRVKVILVDDQGRIKLSIRQAAEPKPEANQDDTNTQEANADEAAVS